VRHDPSAAARYLRIIMSLSSCGGSLVVAACLGYLAQHWASSAFCDRPLRWWLLIYSVLHAVQLPVRMLFLVKLRNVSGTSMEALVISYTASFAWRAGKHLSLVTYGWFILGITWVLNAGDCPTCPGVYRMTVFVLVQALVRAVGALLITRVMLLTNEAGDDAPEVERATPEQIKALPTLKFQPGLFQESDCNCAVCLSEYDSGDVLRRLPCGHHFHVKCADQWLCRSKACPLCRQDIDVPMSKACRHAH